MPELPEVAGLIGFLQTNLLGAMLTRMQVLSSAALKTADPSYADLQGLRLAAVTRHGKFVDMSLTALGSPDLHGAAAAAADTEAYGAAVAETEAHASTAADTEAHADWTPGPLHLIFHLAKAGWVRYFETPSNAVLHPGKGPIAARLTFDQDSAVRSLDLTEAGTRKSLAVYVVRSPSDVPGIAALGPDPLSADFGVPELAGILAAGSGQLKGLLRNQRVIAGIGNAYSDEILHAARLSPFAIARSLDEPAVRALYDAIGNVLGAAVKSAEGKPASALKDTKRASMRVHGRTGQACPVCGDEVREVSFADTSLQYCPTCQTGGKILADRRTSKFLK
ncbi:DNA-formamidopyrimidine glycosylase family protein [Paenarthrobacter sp. PH39-S1]|uniref:DNA-formamidopyrimidine glycosylase family protein n=1 Tax=Paenarthrobacter sp. PH39-S1 TaxID=3046204 RepID=UPI0024BBBF3C|nr:DNA-formamidopyrimidine glycosylase family protein [Paenarthrobacter sp. PH39-S1]MDJ0354541.1 DNA-formamidopyrimidine glycosylase family protein [Paenarthrobacter sp. PH39-S1]